MRGRPDSSAQQELMLDEAPLPPAASHPRTLDLDEELRAFREFGKETIVLDTEVDGLRVPTFVNEFWTARQRQANSLHEVSYRACFKPQLPRFFIERLTRPGDRVYDPFMGRGTTPLEAALMGRVPAGNDINPLSRMLLEPRLNPPADREVAQRLEEIDLDAPTDVREDLLVFYHPDTLRRLCALRRYLIERENKGKLDAVDAWIRMVAINRLTGHSAGFFSVYTLPPNQAVSIKSQVRINERRQQVPPPRDIRAIILKKSRQLLTECPTPLRAGLAEVFSRRLLLTGPAEATRELPDASVQLAVTSPPFLDVVDYEGDNWLRVWFAGIDASQVEITMAKKVEGWTAAMSRVFAELRRVLVPGGHVAFEVGEVRSGKVRLEEAVVRAAVSAGLTPRLILINDQEFTKTANCWGVSNRAKGTNTNRIVLLRRD